MINLSVSDSIDGLGKIDELRNAVGTECPNTGGVLLSVSEDGDRCVVERKVWDYTGGSNTLSIVRTKKVSEPSWLTWNKMFF